MRTMLLAAAAALSLGVGSAYAADSEGASDQAITRFTEIPGVMAQAPAENAPAVATAQNGHAVHAFVTSSRSGYQFPGGVRTRAATTNRTRLTREGPAPLPALFRYAPGMARRCVEHCLAGVVTGR